MHNITMSRSYGEGEHYVTYIKAIRDIHVYLPLFDEDFHNRRLSDTIEGKILMIGVLVCGNNVLF